MGQIIDDFRLKLISLLGGAAALTALHNNDLYYRYLGARGFLQATLIERSAAMRTSLGLQLGANLQTFLTAAQAPTISGAISAYTVGQTVAYLPGIAGGTGTKTWAVVVGAVPAFASFNPATGAVSSGVLQAGDVSVTNFSIQATDVLGLKSNILPLTLTVT